MNLSYRSAAGFAITGMIWILAIRPSFAVAAGLAPAQAQAAQKLYTLKCAKCHKLYDPNGYEQAKWDSWMQKMKKKSKLKPEQFELLSRYIDTNLRTDKTADKR